jgi:hypothetical protein
MKKAKKHKQTKQDLNDIHASVLARTGTDDAF